MKNSIDTIGNRTRVIQARGTVPLRLLPWLRIGRGMHLLPLISNLSELMTYQYTRSFFKISAKYSWTGSINVFFAVL
jgi:hypothetical protein